MLICSDGSEQAENAVRFTANLAAACKAEVSLVGIAESVNETDPLLTSLKRSQKLLLDRGVTTEVITKTGQPIDEILKRTQETHYDLVIIGAVRKSPHGRFRMSSKSYKIIKIIRPPVLVVIGESTSLKRILVCSGGKQYIERAIKIITPIAKGMQATVTLVHVMPEPPIIYRKIRAHEADVSAVLNSNSELGRNLRRQKEAFENAGVPVEVLLPYGFVIEEILNELNRGNYDLVVSGSMISGGPMQTYMMGDITREILNRAGGPVLVVRSREGVRGFLREVKHAFLKLREEFPTKVGN